ADGLAVARVMVGAEDAEVGVAGRHAALELLEAARVDVAEGLDRAHGVLLSYCRSRWGRAGSGRPAAASPARTSGGRGEYGGGRRGVRERESTPHGRTRRLLSRRIFPFRHARNERSGGRGEPSRSAPGDAWCPLRREPCAVPAAALCCGVEPRCPALASPS